MMGWLETTVKKTAATAASPKMRLAGANGQAIAARRIRLARFGGGLLFPHPVIQSLVAPTLEKCY